MVGFGVAAVQFSVRRPIGYECAPSGYSKIAQADRINVDINIAEYKSLPTKNLTASVVFRDNGG